MLLFFSSFLHHHKCTSHRISIVVVDCRGRHTNRLVNDPMADTDAAIDMDNNNKKKQEEKKIENIIFKLLNETLVNYVFTTYLCHIDDIVICNLVCKSWHMFLSDNFYLWKLLLQKHFGNTVEDYISEQGTLIASRNRTGANITAAQYKFRNFCKCLKHNTTLLITPSYPFFHDKISKQEFHCQGLGNLLPVVIDLDDLDNHRVNRNSADISWNSVFDFQNKHDRGFLVGHTEWDMDLFNFGVYDFTIELWCKFDEKFKNQDIMILNYNFFAKNCCGMDFYLCSAWHRGKGNVKETGGNLLVADNSCELFNILDNPDDLGDIGVEKYNKRCDNKFHHVCYTRSNGQLNLYHDGERVASCPCPFSINPNDSDLFIGSRENTNTYGLSEVSTYRIYNGIAKYHGDVIDYEYLPHSPNKWKR